MKKICNIIFYVVSVINAISCIVLLLIFPRVINHENLGFDYMGVIVAILSLLVTILIGWNIFSALDLKKEMLSKIEECRKENKRDLKLHTELNNKDFDNIIKTFKRIENYTDKLDKVIYQHLTENGNK